jgi:chaperonin cofactor prefoldin
MGANSERWWKTREAEMDYTKLTPAELANGISQTETAIQRCKHILDDLKGAKTVGLQAVAKATSDLLPKLEQDLEVLKKAYEKRRSWEP